MAYGRAVMASRKDRFGELGGTGDHAPAPGRTADLFEHYGIAVDPATDTATTAAIEARACRRCGWFLALRRDIAACPLCAEADPHRDPPAKTSAKTSTAR